MAHDNYKQKYLDIRAKLIESTDVAYRLGFEEGLKEGEQAAQRQAEQEQMAMEQAALAGQGMPGEPGMEGGGVDAAPGAADPEQSPTEEAIDDAEVMNQAQGGTELDQHIDELESLVAKGEKPKVTDIRKAVEALASVRKSYKEKTKKRQKKVVSAQKQFVDNILKSWDVEQEEVAENLEDIIREHGLKIENK